jgi:hypothetical protein
MRQLLGLGNMALMALIGLLGMLGLVCSCPVRKLIWCVCCCCCGGPLAQHLQEQVLEFTDKLV